MGAVGRFGLGLTSVFHWCESFFYFSHGNIDADLAVPAGYISPGAPVFWPDWFNEWTQAPDVANVTTWLQAELWPQETRPPQALYFWLPLRWAEATQAEDGKRSFLTQTCPDDDVSAFAKALLGHWPQLWRLFAGSRHVEEVGLTVRDKTHVAALNPDATRLTHDIKKDARIDLNVTVDDQVYNVCGLQRTVATAGDLQNDPLWPTVDSESGGAPTPLDVQPHVAVWTISPAEPLATHTTVSATWATYYPLGNPDPGNHALEIVVHLSAFLDDGRRGFTANNADNASVERRWNHGLVCSVLPLLPAAIHPALAANGDGDLARRVKAALDGLLTDTPRMLGDLDFWRMVGSEGSLAHCLTRDCVWSYQLVPPDADVLNMPAEQVLQAPRLLLELLASLVAAPAQEGAAPLFVVKCGPPIIGKLPPAAPRDIAQRIWTAAHPAIVEGGRADEPVYLLPAAAGPEFGKLAMDIGKWNKDGHAGFTWVPALIVGPQGTERWCRLARHADAGWPAFPPATFTVEGLAQAPELARHLSAALGSDVTLLDDAVAALVGIQQRRLAPDRVREFLGAEAPPQAGWGTEAARGDLFIKLAGHLDAFPPPTRRGLRRLLIADWALADNTPLVAPGDARDEWLFNLMTAAGGATVPSEPVRCLNEHQKQALGISSAVSNAELVRLLETRTDDALQGEDLLTLLGALEAGCREELLQLAAEEHFPRLPLHELVAGGCGPLVPGALLPRDPALDPFRAALNSGPAPLLLQAHSRDVAARQARLAWHTVTAMHVLGVVAAPGVMRNLDSARAILWCLRNDTANADVRRELLCGDRAGVEWIPLAGGGFAPLGRVFALPLPLVKALGAQGFVSLDAVTPEEMRRSVQDYIFRGADLAGRLAPHIARDYGPLGELATLEEASFCGAFGNARRVAGVRHPPTAAHVVADVFLHDNVCGRALRASQELSGALLCPQRNAFLRALTGVGLPNDDALATVLCLLRNVPENERRDALEGVRLPNREGTWQRVDDLFVTNVELPPAKLLRDDAAGALNMQPRGAEHANEAGEAGQVKPADLFPGWDTDAVSTSLLGLLALLLGDHERAPQRLGPDLRLVREALLGALTARLDQIAAFHWGNRLMPAGRVHRALGLPPPRLPDAPLPEAAYQALSQERFAVLGRVQAMLARVNGNQGRAIAELYPLPDAELTLRNLRNHAVALGPAGDDESLLTPREAGGLFVSRVAASPPPERARKHELLSGAAQHLWRGLGEDAALKELIGSIEQAGALTLEKVRGKILSDFSRMCALGTGIRAVSEVVNRVHGMSLFAPGGQPGADALRELADILRANEPAIIERHCLQLQSWGYSPASVPFELIQNADDACLQLAQLGCDDVPDVVVVDATRDRLLGFLHGGRGIGQVTAPGGNRGDAAWAADLVFMLTPLGSGKAPDDQQGHRHATGQFGLGFKSVFLACDRPVVQSYPLGRFEIQATCLPVPLEGEQDAVDLHKRFPAAFRDRLTRFELPLREGVTTAQVLERFRSLLPILLLFTRHVRSCLTHTDAGVEEVRPPLQPLDATGELHFLDAGDLGRAVVFGANPAHRVVLWVDEHGPRRARQPTFWNLAPTRNCEDGPFCFNAPFALHTGRTGLDDHADRHLQVAQELGRVLGEGLMRLLGFAGAPAAEPESAWTALERLLGPLEPTEFLAKLWSTSPLREPVDAGVHASTRDTILLGTTKADKPGALGLVAQAGGIPDSLTAPRKHQRLDQLTCRRRGLLTRSGVFDAVRQALGAGETGWIDEAVYERLRELGGLQVPRLETHDLASLLSGATPEGVARPKVANAMGRPCVRRVFEEDLRGTEEMRRLEELLPRLRFVNANGVPRESRALTEEELHPRYNDDGRWFFGHCSWLGELRRVRRADAAAPQEPPMPARREMAQGPDLQLPLVGADDFERVANWLTRVGVEDAFVGLIPNGLLDAQEDDNPARLLEGIRLAWPRILVPEVLAEIDRLYPEWLPRRRSGRRWQQFVEEHGLPGALAPFAMSRAAPGRGNLDLAPIAELRDFQERAVEGALAALNGGAPRAFVALPTGAGKTRVGLEIVRRVLVASELPCRVLWLAPHEELLDQAGEAFPAVWSRCLLARGNEAAPLRGATWLKAPDALRDPALEGRHVVLFMTTQGADQLEERFEGKLDLLVVDEAHRALDQVVRIQRRCNAQRIVGLSATPVRGGLAVADDNARLHRFFGNPLLNEVLGPDPRRALEERGVLARPNFVDAVQFRGFDPGDPELDGFGNFTDEYVDRATSTQNAFERVARMIAEIDQHDDQSIIFTESRRHSELLWWYVRNRLYQVGRDATGVELIDSTTPTGRRRAIVNGFVQTRTIRHLLNVGILTHGFDAPALRHVVIARPTMSSILYQQMIGRGLRGNGEPNAECNVYDLFRGAFHGRDFFRDIDDLIAGYARRAPRRPEDR